MKAILQNIYKNAMDDIEKIIDLENLKKLKIDYLGKNSEINKILKKLGTFSQDEKAEIGKVANMIRTSINNLISQKETDLYNKILEAKLVSEKLDVTISQNKHKSGHLHPLTIVRRQIEDIFLAMGFEIAKGPEIEYVHYNFDTLNTPQNHPSRDLEDTFYIQDDIVLRTQTSPVQIRTMETKKPPIKLISPGRVYRSDDVDATHSPVFHQIEGLVIGENVSMGHLKWTLETFFKIFYGDDVNIRLRPHYFPFTEPSAEVDISCFACGGKGCKVCKNEGYIEVLGAGMVHPNVLRNCNIDPQIYSGFAFGLGLDRLVMRKYDINDLRLLYDNDIRFLSQF